MGRASLAGTVTLGLVFAVGLGAAAPSFAALPSGDVSTLGLLGSRPGATRFPVQISDQVSGSIDVGTGNLSLSVNALSLPGVSSNVGLGMSFNSLSTDTSAGIVAPRWTLAADSAGTLSTAPTGVLFTSGDGYSALFTPVTGSSTAYTSPAGVKADLVKTGSTGWVLTSRTSASVVTFNTDGKTTKVTDRNNNPTALTWTSGKLTTVLSTRGVAGARTATLAYDSYTGLLNSISQISGASSRSVSFTHDPYGNLTGFTDLAGKTTTFGYTANRVTQVISPAGGVTNFSYDATGRVNRVEQVNTTTGSPGNSITRLAYPSSTQTLLAGPNTDQAVAVATGPHTTYTLTTTGRVASVTDPMGRARSSTYTADFDTLTATQGTGTTAGTTTNTFGANMGQSLTQTTAPGGASSQLAYANTAASTKYLPTSATSGAGNESLFTFDGAGNALTASDALAATASLTHNTDGTVATALAPGNGSNKTSYTYNSNHELTTVTPVTGSSLTAQSRTYDVWGRLLTQTTGAGTTLTYSYDGVGRLAGTSFSDTTHSIAYTYNTNGQTLTRTDGAGTTSYAYDQMGRLTSRTNTAGGGTISYGYDRASNLASTTDTRGTTTYAFDASGVPTSLTYQYNGGNHVLAFATDDRGRRTDTWMDTNPAHTTWAAHTHTDYDTTGRVTRTTAQVGTGDSDNRPVMDISYCHAAGSVAPTCPTNTSADRANIQWVKDNLTGSVTAYSYDGANRLTQAAITGGTTPAITYNYSYDVRGNRLTATTTGATTTSQTLTANPANQISTTGYSYDGTGNLTADPAGTYSYNGASQLTQATKSGTTYNYSYAGASNNELLAQSTPNGYYKYTYGRTDAQGQPVIEQLNRDNSTAYIEHDPVTGEPLMLRTSTGMQSLYITDGTGNPAALITSGNYVALATSYDPYGVQTITKDAGGNASVQNPYTFKNGIQDRTTGWIKYGARYYQPTTGRWTQQDTLDQPLDPANANRYAYAANNPINLTDPTGYSCGSCVAKSAIGGVLGGAAGGFFGGLLTAVLGPEAPIITVGPAVLIGAVSVGVATTIGGLIICE
ncbi:RHS repeat-associated core domain-containing protein [Arthrobacter alpinus]|uniref:RHS repeat-associated core domain-containing protein n=1 Tax=Arthrobacter alpinus TaxID=656366 RepID=UPI001648D0D8|nr:RHS repeat-associated core domain-containing protein [Arthrobacter alpinus]